VTDGPLLADTHILIWYLGGSPQLEPPTSALLDAVTARYDPILISAASLVELTYLAEKGTLSEEHLDAVHAALDADGTGFEVVPIDDVAAWAVGRVPRAAVADPFDRMIAATALARGVPLVTYDRKLLAVPGLPTVR
jgi:PIN domain nuclease of toxin-antitoxin system